jgi:fumarate reductase flavoprotein subunit
METPAKKIMMEDGKVAGVLAVDKNGEEIEIQCKAAIVCTGGAGANKQMILDETGYHHGEDLHSFAIPGLVGDGLKMAWEAGAGKTQVRIESAAGIEGMDDLPQGIANIFSQPNLLVNKFGKRVMNEEHMQNATYLSNVAAHQKDKTCFSIVDSSIVKYYVRNGVDNVSLVRTNPDVSDFYDGVKMAQEHGNAGLIVADSIEELAEKAGISVEGLVETVEDYNDYCDGVDEEFFKNRRYLRAVHKAPFYCAKVRPGGYGTVGGIRINENCEAVTDGFEPVLGLYAAGADSCNIYDDSYMFLLPGNSMGYAVNTGRIAGMSAAEYLENQ